VVFSKDLGLFKDLAVFQDLVGFLRVGFDWFSGSWWFFQGLDRFLQGLDRFVFVGIGL